MERPTALNSGRRPGLPGQALMLYAVDVDPENAPAFEAWYTHEHLPERVALPGFLRGRRYVRTSGSGREHLTLYDVRDTAVFSSPAYLARLEDPTPLTREVVGTLRHPNRVVLDVVFSQGAATGRELAVLSLPTDDSRHLAGWVASELATAALADPNASGLHLAVPHAEATGAKAATAEGRDAAETADARCVLLLDGVRRVAEQASRMTELCRRRGWAGEPTVYEHLVTLLPD